MTKKTKTLNVCPEIKDWIESCKEYKRETVNDVLTRIKINVEEGIGVIISKR